MVFRSSPFYGKIITSALVALVFLFYIKNLQVNEGYAATTFQANKLKENHRHHSKSSRHFDENENETQRPVKQPTYVDIKSPLEVEIQKDLAKQEPGLGDHGKAVILEGAAKLRGEEIYKKIFINEELSEHLSYNRILDDYRHPLCVKQHFDRATLPTTSVIIIFFNEPYSVVLRTVHSTLNTCSGQLLKQIILVDDGSTNEELGEKLSYYIRTRLPQDKVSVVRLKNRLGLIRARLAGARVATGDVLIFLDAHCEATIGWCEPLLQRIKDSRNSLVVPIIDIIDAKDFNYNTVGDDIFQIGGFLWSGNFEWIYISDRERARQRHACAEDDLAICPTHSPTMAGGLFAIDRSYFWKLGSYDDQVFIK